jgi:SAM-dependent methyltransferase
MEFTGERYMPEVAGGIKYEHLHRYLFCRAYVKDKVVLDIASGEGYGSRHLAEGAARVFGVDIDAEAVAHAGRKYAKDNLSFHVGSCETIPLEDASVDVVVSFETIEHHDKHQEMMSEIKRVLKPGGVLIISSPNKYVHQDINKSINPYHVKELYEDEFKALMKSYFKDCQFLEQKLVVGSALAISGGGPGQTVVCHESAEFSPSEDMIPAIQNPYYFMAICSDTEIDVRHIKSSIYLEQNDNLLFDYVAALIEVNREAVELKRHLEEQRKHFQAENTDLKQKLERFAKMPSVRLLRCIKGFFLNKTSRE